MSGSHVLLINCPDQKGLVFKISGVVYDHQLNIISNGEFVDKSHNHFFMRTEFSGDYNHDLLINDLSNVLPEDVNLKLTEIKKKNVIIFVTKEHHCLGDLLVRHVFNEQNANILCVVSNYQYLEDLTLKFQIPFHFISHQNKTREEHEAEILKLLDQYDPELLVLAKYMRVLSSDFIKRYKNRIINIHHSFLPAFIGANPYKQAYSRGVKIIGATAHFANENLDEGPIIAQSVIPVDHSQSAREMAQAGRDVEKIVLAKSLNLVLNERVFVFRNKTIIFD